MKIKKIGKTAIIMNNSSGKANYFGWPSVAKLQNGKIAVTASGFRYAHVCPFGKAVISYSEDNGQTYTTPTVVIDTPLDDRDAGILAFGKSGVIVTSFNDSVEYQRTHPGYGMPAECDREKLIKFFDTITPEDEKKYLGSEFRISRDYGITFGDIHKCPVSSPHGPCVLHDGTVLWVGKVFSADDTYTDDIVIKSYVINPDDSSEELGTIPSVTADGERLTLCEPCALELPDGKIICHIRAQRYENGKYTYFTTYQSESYDGGKT